MTVFKEAASFPATATQLVLDYLRVDTRDSLTDLVDPIDRLVRECLYSPFVNMVCKDHIRSVIFLDFDGPLIPLNDPKIVAGLKKNEQFQKEYDSLFCKQNYYNGLG